MLPTAQATELAPQDAALSWEAFRVAEPVAREDLLRQLLDCAAAVLLHAADGSSISTTLVGVDAEQGWLTFAPQAAIPQLERIVECDEAVATAYVDSVRLQFDLRGFIVVQDERGRALRSALPVEMLRFQRREAFRVRTPSRPAPLARLRHPAIPDMQLALRVLDLSLGGCSLWLPDDIPALQPGTCWAEVRIELDPATSLRAALTLQHVTAFAPQAAGVRAGCAWTLARPEDQRVLQRWIDDAQKRTRIRGRA